MWHFSPYWRPQVNAQVSAQLQLNPWVLGGVGRSSSLLALLGQALPAVALCPPGSCQPGTQPQWDPPCCPYWNLSCRSVCSIFSPHGFSASKILAVGVRSQALAWWSPYCCARRAKNTVLILQHQGNSEIARELLYVLPLVLESLKMFELFGEVAHLSRSLCIDYPLCDK